MPTGTHQRDPIARLHALPRFGSGVGRGRMTALTAELRRPGTAAAAWWTGLDAIKVTGTDGKGSVATMTAAILDRLGIGCGLYTSPHLRRFAERIAIDGHPLPAGELAVAAGRAADAVDAYSRRHPGETVGAFEAITLAACLAFARRRPEAVVAEAGIGGRYDPVGVLPGRIAALVSVDLEHTALLGETVEEIALDKADLAPPGGLLVTGALAPELSRRLAGHAAARGVRVEPAVGPATVRVRSVGPGGTVADLRLPGLALPRLEIGLAGAHQATNAALAITLATRWLARHRAGLASGELERAVRTGLAEATLPGRLERLDDDPPLWIDIAHTPQAIQALAAAVREVSGEQVVLVAGVSEGRDPADLLAPLVPLAAAVVVTRAHHRGRPADEVLAALTRRWPRLEATAVPDLEAALTAAREAGRRRGLAVLVAGGLFLAAEVAEAMAGGDPRTLRFL